MRKYLLSTSAIAGVSLMSSLALADVSIGGYVEFQYNSTDSDITANDGTATGSDAEVSITFTNKTDSGLDITYNSQIDTDSAGGSIDQHSLTIAGGFGTLVMGIADGAEDKYAVNPGAVTQEESNGATLTNTASTTRIGSSTGAAQDGDASKISYHMPPMGGLTAGISTRTTQAGGADMTSMGANYALEAAGAAVTLGYSAATTEGAAKDTDSSSMGMTVVTNGFTIMVAQSSFEATGEDYTTDSMGIGYTLANGVALGAFTVKSQDDIDVSEEYSATHYEMAYTIASGLTAVLTVSDFDYENGTSADAATVDENGTITSFNIKASF
jgi:hypothetical protein